VSKRIEKDKAMFVGQEISGKTLGVVGLGQIGARVVDAALALGMKVVGYDPVLSVEAALMLPGDRMQVGVPSPGFTPLCVSSVSCQVSCETAAHTDRMASEPNATCLCWPTPRRQLLGLFISNTVAQPGSISLVVPCLRSESDVHKKRGGSHKHTQRVDKLEDLLKQSDYITLHTPYIKGVTHHLLNSETLAQCKPGVNLLNFARGEIVDGAAVKVGPLVQLSVSLDNPAMADALAFNGSGPPSATSSLRP
jgi:hypothetical protein